MSPSASSSSSGFQGEKLTEDHGVEPEHAQDLARQLFRAYVHQVASEGVYHADPHRGNVLLTEDGDGRLALLDFGLLGRLDDDTRTTISQLLLAIARGSSTNSAASCRAITGGRCHGFAPEKALADLQRLALEHRIRLPPSFALVGKTLSQADTIAPTLDPELDPIALLDDDAFGVMLREAERRLEPKSLLSYLFTQLEPLLRLPRRLSQTVDRLETGTLKFGIVPTDLGALEGILRTTANRLGVALIIAGRPHFLGAPGPLERNRVADRLRRLSRARALLAVEGRPHARRAIGTAS